MSPRRIRELLEAVRRGEATVGEALEQLRHLPFESLGEATLDHHRELRCGHAEVVLAAGKTPEQVQRIAKHIVTAGANLLVTRLEPALARALKRRHPRGKWNQPGRIFGFARQAAPPGNGTVLVISAGTSDVPVAEEAAFTLEFTGNRVERIYDVGVAGVHRLLAHAPRLSRAQAIVVVAGMEGALASVVGGLTDRPVIAVPTSTGYGASFQGVAALLGMLNSCASGVSVVNIDNGFGAGFTANLINHLPAGKAPAEAARRLPRTRGRRR
ncbi:MAG: nickel pincer cofactor biosynthesis protein LarB [Candidatus Eisenbacteria bacterium]|nr:nickel pincer cofactor biosynthesis protein LarB [Candidatus Eisenbacteria bacterium]